MSVRGLPQPRTEDKHLGRGVGVEPGVQACGPCESHSLVFSVLTANIRKLEGMALSFLQPLTGLLRLFSLLPFWNNPSERIPLPLTTWRGDTAGWGGRTAKGREGPRAQMGTMRRVGRCLGKMAFAGLVLGKLTSAWRHKWLNGK